jgi:predicted RNA binding protein YcfA (HicA-like mRNA interferase family)
VARMVRKSPEGGGVDLLKHLQSLIWSKARVTGSHSRQKPKIGPGKILVSRGGSHGQS